MLIKMYIQYPYPDIDIINIIRMTNMLAILNIAISNIIINNNINKIWEPMYMRSIYSNIEIPLLLFTIGVYIHK